MADTAISPRVSRAKKLTININREERKNEPDLTLGHLVSLTHSIVDAFSPGRKINFPNAYSLLLLDGENQEINARGASFPLTLTHFKGQEGDGSLLGTVEQKVLGQFFPDDVASILKSIQFFITKEYGQRKQRTFHWGYDINSVATEINSAREIRSLQTIATGNLKRAAEETLTIIQGLLKEVADKDAVDLDDAQPIINKIEAQFKNSSQALEYQKIWEELGEELTQSLAEHDRQVKIVIISNQKFSASDARRIINVFYEQIVEQIEKPGELKEPWNQISATTKGRFSSRNALYFSTNELQQLEINIGDTTKARAFMEWINQLLEELKKEPAKKETSSEGGGGDDGGGEASEEPTKKTPAGWRTQQEIATRAIDDLVTKSSKIFTSYFSDVIVDPSQRDWLLIRLAGEIKSLIEIKKLETSLKTKVTEWILHNLTPESEKNLLYDTNDAQLEKLNIFLATEFFTENKTEFLLWIESVPTVEELKKSKPVEPSTPEVEVVVPDVAKDTTEETTPTTGLDLTKERAARDLTTEFLVAKFGEEGEFLRAFIQAEIANGLPANPTKADLDRLKGQIFNKLQFNEQVFKQAQDYYQEKIKQISQNNPVSIGRIYSTIDSILILSQDPQKYFSRLNDNDLLEHFGLQNANLDVKQFRGLLSGLITLRRYAAGGNITPWFTDEEDENKKIPQALGGVRTFVQNYGEDGVAALNLDENGIDSSGIIDAHRKETIKQLYRDLWISSVAGKSQEELFDIYVHYGVDVISIDFNALPTPDGFIYDNRPAPPGFTLSDAAQHANLRYPTAGQAKRAGVVKKLFSEGKQKLGKAALSAVAPELAPYLAALENIPLLGEIAKDIEEKAGNLILIALGAGAAALVGLLSRGIGALAWGVGGGILGFFVGGPAGAAVGVGLGGYLGGGGFKTIGNWFKGLGQGSGTGAGVGQIAQAGIGGGGAAVSTKLVPLTYGGVAAGTVIVSMVAGGSQLHPTYMGVNTLDQTGEQSRYVSLKKTADVGREVENPPDKIIYTITISADKGYSITINSSKDVSLVSFSDEKKESESKEKNISELDRVVVNNGESISFEYTQDYGSYYMDSRITNSFSIDFSYQNNTESGDDTASTSYSVGIGDYPIGDGCWPTTGELTQGPLGQPSKYGVSHSNIQAIDIHNSRGTPIFTPFDGEACAYPQDSGWLCGPSAIGAYGTQYCYGNHVVLNAGVFTVGFAHMDSFSSEIDPGSCKQISAGTLIGTMGNSGLLNYGPKDGIHLHYELRPKSLNFSDYVPGPMEIHQITEICPN